MKKQAFFFAYLGVYCTNHATPLADKHMREKQEIQTPWTSFEFVRRELVQLCE